MIDEVTIFKAAGLLLRAAPPGSEVILFGSHARGNATADSDLDFLVVEPELKAKHSEMVRLRDVLRPLHVPVDVLVTSRTAFEEWRNTPNNVLFEAWTEGRPLHEMGGTGEKIAEQSRRR
jgi:predicted nucleotidyltransferase